MVLLWSWLKIKGNGFDWLVDENLNGDVREAFFKGLRSYREVCLLKFLAHILKGKFEESLRYLEQATVGIRPHDNADVLSWRGEVHLALGQLDQGMSFL